MLLICNNYSRKFDSHQWEKWRNHKLRTHVTPSHIDTQADISVHKRTV